MFSFLLSLVILFGAGWFIWRKASKAWAFSDAKDTLDKLEQDGKIVRLYEKSVKDTEKEVEEVKAKQQKENVNANT